MEVEAGFHPAGTVKVHSLSPAGIEFTTNACPDAGLRQDPLIAEETEPTEARVPKTAVYPENTTAAEVEAHKFSVHASDPGADIAFAAKAPKPRIRE